MYQKKFEIAKGDHLHTAQLLGINHYNNNIMLIRA